MSNFNRIVEKLSKQLHTCSHSTLFHIEIMLITKWRDRIPLQFLSIHLVRNGSLLRLSQIQDEISFVEKRLFLAHCV